MEHRTRAWLIALSMGALFAAESMAQRPGELVPAPGPPRLDIWFGWGSARSTDWTDRVVLETTDADGERTARLVMPEITMPAGPALAGGVAYWRGPFGARFHGAYTRACFAAGVRRCDPAPDPGTAEEFVTELEVWSLGVQGLVTPVPDLAARIVRPYFLLGAGGLVLDPAARVPGLMPVEETGGGEVGTVIVSGGTGDLAVTLDRLDRDVRLALDIGVGLDLLVPIGLHGVGLRLEAVDRIMTSPIAVRIDRLDDDVAEPASVELRRSPIHTFQLTIGVIVDIGLPDPAPTAVTAARRWR